MNQLTVGFVVNPFAGIGGAVALKGSDGAEVRAEAMRRGAVQKAPQRACEALTTLFSQTPTARTHVRWLTAQGEMGASILQGFGVTPEVLHTPVTAQTEAIDTQAVISAFLAEGIDLLIFAGGDGTARDVFSVLDEREIPVIGIPAGVKIHSGVYAIHPRAAGKVAGMVLAGELTTVRWTDVMDIDEQAFRQGTVRAKRYGELLVPSELEYMQAVKVGGKESDELVLTDIADDVIEAMEDDALYIMGSGSTVAAIMERMGLENTLLGVDAVVNGELIGRDLSAQALLDLAAQYREIHLVVTAIGGQGHILGRGNQQLSAELLKKIPREHIHLVATKQKLQALQGKPLIVDSGDAELDGLWAGLIAVTTGYHDRTMVTIASF